MSKENDNAFDFSGLDGIIFGDETPTTVKTVKDDNLTAEEQAKADEAARLKAEEDAAAEAEKLRLEEEKNKSKEPVLDNPFQLITNLVQEEAGLFKNVDLTKVQKPEDLIGAIQDEIKEGVEDYKNSLPDVIKQLADAYEDGVPLSEMLQLKDEQIILANIDEESLTGDEADVELQKSLYRTYLKVTTKYSDAKIEKMIDTSEGLDELGNEAVEALKELKILNAQEEERIKAEAKAQKIKDAEIQKETLKKVEDLTKTEIFTGIKLTEKEQKELYSQMTKPAGVTKEGQAYSKVAEVRSKDPLKFETMLNFLVMKGVFDGDLSSLTKKSTTSAIKKIEEAAEKTIQGWKSGHGNQNQSNDNVSKSILDAI
jgi:hypothetical protein